MNANQYVSVTEPVDWKQGMLVSPQHFQQHELYVDQLTTHKLYLSQPYFWGLVDIDLNQDLLESGKVRISRLHTVLPDGQVLAFDENRGDAGLLEAIPEREASAEQGILVSIGVFRRGARADGDETQMQLQRYRSVAYRDVADENHPDRKIDMYKKRVMARLFFGEVTDTRFVTTPLFKLYPSQKGYRLGGYHPPMLDASVSKTLLGESSIWQILKRAVASIRAKAKDLAAVSSGGSVEDTHTISMLLAKVPTLEVLLDMKMVHPFQLYMAFVDLVASAAATSLRNKPFQPVGYNHEHPGRSFEAYLSYLNTQVSSVQPAFRTYRFTRGDGGSFELDLGKIKALQDRPLNELILRVVPEPGQHSEIAQQWVKNARIGSAEQMQSLMKTRTYGLARTEIAEDRRASLRLPLTGAVVSVVAAGKSDSVSAQTRLQIQGAEKAVPQEIHLCVPRQQLESGAGNS